MNRLKQFALEKRLRVKKDECGDPMICAKRGHIYEHSDDLLGVVLSESPAYSNKVLLARRRQLVKAGLTLHQAGEAESILLFDPVDANQVNAAIRAVGARRKRNQTPGQLFNLRKGPEKRPLQAARNDAMAEDGSISQPVGLEASATSIPVVQPQGNDSYELAGC
jgi:hypothetical protein